MAGLPFTQLPAMRGSAEWGLQEQAKRDASPEQEIQKELQTGRKAVQDRFNLKWNTINANARFLGKGKHQAMLRQLHAEGKQEMLQYNQEAEQRMAQFNQINNIEQSGGLTPDTAAKLKAGAAYGQRTAEAMYPAPDTERSIPKQFGELELYGRRISDALESFQPPEKPSKLGTAISAVSPLGGLLSTYRKLKNKLKVWDSETNGYVIASPEETARYVALLREEGAIEERMSELLGDPSIVKRKVQPGTKGGTFSDKISESFKKPAPKRREVNNDPLGLF